MPEGWGAAFSFVRYLRERWMPSVRGGFDDDGGTLDVQLMKDPALNPTVDTIWMFGIRARLAI